MCPICNSHASVLIALSTTEQKLRCENGHEFWPWGQAITTVEQDEADAA